MTDLRVGDVVTADLNLFAGSDGTKILRTYAHDHGNVFTVEQVDDAKDEVLFIRLREFSRLVFRSDRFKRIETSRISITDNDLQELLDG